MNHYQGIIPDERWKNDVLEEIRSIRKLLEKQIPTLETVEPIKNRPGRKKVIK